MNHWINTFFLGNAFQACYVAPLKSRKRMVRIAACSAPKLHQSCVIRLFVELIFWFNSLKLTFHPALEKQRGYEKLCYSVQSSRQVFLGNWKVVSCCFGFSKSILLATMFAHESVLGHKYERVRIMSKTSSEVRSQHPRRADLRNHFPLDTFHFLKTKDALIWVNR